MSVPEEQEQEATADSSYQLLEVQDLDAPGQQSQDTFDQPYEAELQDFDPQLLTDLEQEPDAF